MSGSTFSMTPGGKLVDYYEALGLSKTATTKEIQSAYRKLALKCHPDKNPNNSAAAEKFKQLTRYKEVLEDEVRRKRYDKAVEDGESYAEEDETEQRDNDSSSGRSRSPYSRSSRSRSATPSSQSSYKEDIYDSYWKSQPNPPVYPRDSEQPQKSRPRARRSDSRQGGPPHREYYYSQKHKSGSRRMSQDHGSSRETSSDQAGGTSRGYSCPSPSNMRNRSDRAQWLYDDILKRCKRICKNVKRANELLETFEKLGGEELKSTKKDGGNFEERLNAGMFCIMVDILFEIIEASAKVYKSTLWILDDAVHEKRDAMPLLLKVDAQMRGLEGSWLVTERMLDMIDNGLEREGWPVSAITFTLEKIVKTWDKDLDLPSDLHEIIRVVQKAKMFEYEMNRSSKTIRIDRS